MSYSGSVDLGRGLEYESWTSSTSRLRLSYLMFEVELLEVNLLYGCRTPMISAMLSCLGDLGVTGEGVDTGDTGDREGVEPIGDRGREDVGDRSRGRGRYEVGERGLEGEGGEI